MNLYHIIDPNINLGVSVNTTNESQDNVQVANDDKNNGIRYKYNATWTNNQDYKYMKLNEWLEEVKSDTSLARCKTCNKEFKANITIIKQHWGNKTHQKDKSNENSISLLSG